jgi:hypothetical protein
MARDYVQEYFPSAAPAAPLAVLREITGLTDEDEYSDSVLTRACKVAVQLAEREMGGLKAFKREQTLYLYGGGGRVLDMREPLYVLNSVSIVDPETKEIDEELVAGEDFVAHSDTVAADGGWERYRLLPRLERRTTRWLVGTMYAIDGEWGVVDEDGDVPIPIQRAVARIAVIEVAPVADEDANERRKVGSVTSHRVSGRSVTFRTEAARSGVITEAWVRETLRAYRIPRIVASAGAYPANYQ